MESRLIKLLSILAFLFASVISTFANPYIFENVRITVITEGLVRMEYTVDGKFNDDRTMFAWNRDRL